MPLTIWHILISIFIKIPSHFFLALSKVRLGSRKWSCDNCCSRTTYRPFLILINKTFFLTTGKYQTGIKLHQHNVFIHSNSMLQLMYLSSIHRRNRITVYSIHCNCSAATVEIKYRATAVSRELLPINVKCSHTNQTSAKSSRSKHIKYIHSLHQCLLKFFLLWSNHNVRCNACKLMFQHRNFPDNFDKSALLC